MIGLSFIQSILEKAIILLPYESLSTKVSVFTFF